MKVVDRISFAVVTGFALVYIVPSPCMARKSDVSTTSFPWQRVLHALDGVPFLMEKRRSGPNHHRSMVMGSISTRNNNNNTTNSHKFMDGHNTKEAVVLREPSSFRRHRSLEFGDYMDPTYSCPPMTTCPVVCVASMENCPEDARCPGTHPESNQANPDHQYEVSVALLCPCSSMSMGELFCMRAHSD